MNKPSQERIERVEKEMTSQGIMLGHPYRKRFVELALTADDSHLAAENERLRKLLGEAEEALEFYADRENTCADMEHGFASWEYWYDGNMDCCRVAKETLTKIRTERGGVMDENTLREHGWTETPDGWLYPKSTMHNPVPLADALKIDNIIFNLWSNEDGE